MALDPLLANIGNQAEVGGLDPMLKDIPSGAGSEEEKPSYGEIAKTGLKEGFAGAMKMYEIPSRKILESTGLAGPGTFASEALTPTEEEEKRSHMRGIPGEIIKGFAGIPGGLAKYGPLTAMAPGIAGGAAAFGAEQIAEDWAAGKPMSPTQVGESAGIGAIFGLLDRVPGGRAARAAIMSGTFGTQAFIDTYLQTKDINQALRAAVAPGVVGAALGATSRGKGPATEQRPIPEPVDWSGHLAAVGEVGEGGGETQIGPYPKPGFRPSPFDPRRPYREGPTPTTPMEPMTVPFPKGTTPEGLALPPGQGFTMREPTGTVLRRPGMESEGTPGRGYEVRIDPTTGEPIYPPGRGNLPAEAPKPETPAPTPTPEGTPAVKRGKSLSEGQMDIIKDQDIPFNFSLIQRWLRAGEKPASVDRIQSTIDDLLEKGEIEKTPDNKYIFKEKPIIPPDVEGLKYDGMQDLSQIGEPNLHQFTDTETGSTFNASDISEGNLIANRDRIRKTFKDAAEKGKPSPEEIQAQVDKAKAGAEGPDIGKGFAAGDPVKVGDFKGVINEKNSDGTYSIGAPDGKMMDAPAEAIEADVPDRILTDTPEGKPGWKDKEGNVLESPRAPDEPPPVAEPEPKPTKERVAPETLGLVDVDDQQRYFTKSRVIDKGKNKGMVEITLTDGKKKIVDATDVRREPAGLDKKKPEEPEAATGQRPTEPLAREATQGFADEKLKSYPNAPRVNVVKSADEIPDRITNQFQENMGNGIKGVYDPYSKEIYLVSDMMGSETDVNQTIEHEAVGHFGSEAFLGKDADPFFNRIYLKYGRSGLKDIAEERGFDLNAENGRLAAAREKFAQLAESGESPGLIKQFYGWVREQLAKVFPDLKLSDSEIQRMIQKSREFLASDEVRERNAKVEALRKQVKSVTGLTPETFKAYEPAQFSIFRAAKEVGEASYKEELKPKLEGITATWDWLKKAFDPTVGVDVKDMDEFNRMKGDQELARVILSNKIENGIKEISQGLDQKQQVDFIDKIQMGTKIDELPPDLQEYARSHRVQEEADWIRANSELPERMKIAHLEGHVRNVWKTLPKGLDEEIERKGFTGLFRRPLEGTRAPLYHQYWTLKEGMEHGGVPLTTNLLELTKIHSADTWKLITANRMWEHLGAVGHRRWVRFGEQAPEGFKPLDDPIARKYWDPQTEGELKEAEALGLEKPKVPAAYQAKPGQGRWWVEENAARLLQNHLSRDYVRESSFFRGIMGMKNITTALELGFSAFHASFETFQASAANIGLGLRKVVNEGMIKEGLKDIITSPKAGYDVFREGRNYARLFKNREAFETSDIGQKFLKAHPDAMDNLGWLFWGGGSIKMNEAYRINSYNTFKENLNSKNYIGAAMRSIPALSQFMMKPLFETYIPMLKLGQFMRNFEFAKVEQAEVLMSGKKTMPGLAFENWKSIENQFGEMNFDNLWWNRTMKSGLQMVTRSVTWKLGNIKEYGKGVGGQSTELMSALREGRMPKLTPEMAWMWGVASLTAAMAGVVQYVATGKHPEDWKDLVYPQIDNQGGRLSLPTYSRDAFSGVHSPIKYMASSAAGWLGRFIDIYSNKDFYGTQIHDPHENIINQRIDDLIHLVPLPFSVQSMQRMRAEGQTPARQAAGFFGATKAPYWIERTDAEQKASELKAAHLPIGGRSPQDFQRGQLIKNYARRYQEAILKNEPTDDIMTELHGDIGAGKLRMQDLLTFRQRITKEPLTQAVMHLQFRDVLDVYNVASSNERKQLLPILNKKFYGIRSPEDRMTYMPKMRQIMEESRVQ